MLSEYQLRIADHYKIPIGNVGKLMPNFSDKEKCVIHYENLKLCLRLVLKLKNTPRIRIQLISICKTICLFQYKKKNRKKTKWGQRCKKALHKLMDNAVYGKLEMEKLGKKGKFKKQN